MGMMIEGWAESLEHLQEHPAMREVTTKTRRSLHGTGVLIGWSAGFPVKTTFSLPFSSPPVLPEVFSPDQVTGMFARLYL